MRKSFILLTMIITIYSFMFTQEVPLDLQGKLILKILEFDKNFDSFGDPVKIGVSSDEVYKIFNSLQASITVKGKAIVVEKMNVLADISKFKVIYVDKNWAIDYKGAAQKAIENNCLMFVNDTKIVEQEIAAIGFKLMDNKPKIVIALATAKKMGSDFPASFLQLAVIIGSL